MPVSRKRGVFSPAAIKRRRALWGIRKMGKLITSQDMLDHCLLEVDDVQKRIQMYELIKPHLKFRSHFPSKLNLPALALPTEDRVVHGARSRATEILIPRS